ncbi:hypothetical protein [uncultured Brevundimonas sp.]|uniref:hypothetical protein n=1 Tax=uncultured Brevundimonas sp. TaxID=213418 RepID=UPI0025CC5A11|nr:hypothetical protein [uncultured Brevundimonas sp.]
MNWRYAFYLTLPMLMLSCRVSPQSADAIAVTYQAGFPAQIFEIKDGVFRNSYRASTVIIDNQKTEYLSAERYEISRASSCVVLDPIFQEDVEKFSVGINARNISYMSYGKRDACDGDVVIYLPELRLDLSSIAESAPANDSFVMRCCAPKFDQRSDSVYNPDAFTIWRESLRLSLIRSTHNLELIVLNLPVVGADRPGQALYALSNSERQIRIFICPIWPTADPVTRASLVYACLNYALNV